MTVTTVSSKPKATLHPVLVNLDGVGVLITGEAGTGKSECSLELITRRGHQLMADDMAEVARTGHAASARQQSVDLIIQFRLVRMNEMDAFPVIEE